MYKQVVESRRRPAVGESSSAMLVEAREDTVCRGGQGAPCRLVLEDASPVDNLGVTQGDLWRRDVGDARTSERHLGWKVYVGPTPLLSCIPVTLARVRLLSCHRAIRSGGCTREPLQPTRKFEPIHNAQVCLLYSRSFARSGLLANSTLRVAAAWVRGLAHWRNSRLTT